MWAWGYVERDESGLKWQRLRGVTTLVSHSEISTAPFRQQPLSFGCREKKHFGLFRYYLQDEEVVPLKQSGGHLHIRRSWKWLIPYKTLKETLSDWTIWGRLETSGSRGHKFCEVAATLDFDLWLPKSYQFICESKWTFVWKNSLETLSK